MEETSTVAIHREADPPLTAPGAMSRSVIRKNPGGITYIPTAANHEALRPLYEVKFNLEHGEMKAEAIRTRVRKGFYNDLFLAITALEQQQGNVTATQIIQMQQEKLLQLGPFIERQEVEVLDKILEWTVHEVVQNPKLYELEEPPAQIGNLLNFKIEYVSLLAQAQQVTQVRVVDETVQTAGAWMAAFPEIMDNIDGDEAIRTRGSMTGSPSVMFRDMDAVKQIRLGRQKQQEQVAQTQQALALAKAAKDAGSVPLNPQEPNIAQRLMDEAQATGVY
jgi:hypothetical protein